jgi:RNA polymerase sigma-70 factor (ECF subfamily)
MVHDARKHDFESDLKPIWLRAQAGDEAAYRTALACIATRIRAYFRRRLPGSPDDVEDLVQETLLALHLHRATHDPGLPVSAWVLAIARHKLVDLWRRHGRREALHDPLDEDDLAVQPPTPPGGGTHLDLEQLLRSLPEAQRQAILLTKVEGLSIVEASRRTGASPSAVKVRVHRGLKRLAALIKERP